MTERQITPAQEAIVLKMYAAGEATADIAAAADCSNGSIYTILRRNGLEADRSPHFRTGKRS